MTAAAGHLGGPFGSETAAYRWLKASMTAWFMTKSAEAISPFESFFRPNFELHELLFKIYQTLPQSGKASYALRQNFRTGVASLIAEPEILNWHPVVAIELVRLGGNLGSMEVLESATAVLARSNFGNRSANFHDSETILAVEIYQNVVEANYTGPKMLAFLEACKSLTSDESIDPSHLLIHLALHDRCNWAMHAISISAQLHSFFLRRSASEEDEFILEFFASDLIDSLKPLSSDFPRILIEGATQVGQSDAFDDLQFLFALQDIAIQVERCQHSIVPFLQIVEQPTRGFPGANNAYRRYLEKLPVGKAS